MATGILDVKDDAQAMEILLLLQEREKLVVLELDTLLEEQTQMDIKMATFKQMRPTLCTLSSNASQLNASISKASVLAESVSSKVRVLDLAKGHIYAAMTQVDDVIDLKSCVEEVQRYLQREEYGKAAVQIHHYLSLDQALLQEASPGEGQSGHTSTSFTLLKQYELNLTEVVRSKFNHAMDSQDSVAVEKFFRLFPLLNLHQEGLDKFSSHLQAKICSRAADICDLSPGSMAGGERAGVVFADMLTQLFEEVAAVLDEYYSVVHSCYGNSYMLHFLQQLQGVCDDWVEKCLKMQREERSLDSKVSTVGVALKAKAAVGAIRPDVLELDLLLTECSMCSSSCELYFRFLKRKLASDTTHGDDASSHGNSDLQLLSGCGTRQAMEVLISKYIVLENYFMSESLSKAVRMDSWSSDSYTSSMADDIFFVLQKCIKRALSTSNVDCTCAMLNHARTLLEDDYKQVLQRRISASLPSSTAGLDLGSMLQGRLSARANTAADMDTNKLSYMVSLNDVEVSIENLYKLTKALEVESAKLVTQVGGSSGSKLQSCLADLSGSAAKFKALRQEGICKLLGAVIMPRLMPALDVFSTLDHILTEEKLISYEVNDPFVHQLVKVLQCTLDSVKAESLQQLYEQIAVAAMSESASKLEELVLKSTFNQLGGLQLDRDIRSLLGYLTSLTAWPVRDKFARLSGMATLLSLETVGELMDYCGDGSGGFLMWHLNALEIRRILKLRTDFSAEEVDGLKL